MNPDGIADQLQRARFLFRGGELKDAEEILNAVLAQQAKNPEALGLLATTVYLRGEKKLSKKLWKQSLVNAKRPEVFLANLHAFLVALFKEGNREGAVKQAKQSLPDWPVSVTPNDDERDMLVGLADMLAELGQLNSAHRILETLTLQLPGDKKAKASFALILMMQEQYESALKIFTELDQAIRPKVDINLLVRIHQCAQMLGDEGLKASVMHRAADAYPVYVAPERQGQAKNVLIVVRKRPRLRQAVSSARDLFSTGNYPSQLAKLLAKEFRFSFVFSGVQDAKKILQSIPAPDLIINNRANPERLIREEGIDEISSFIDGFGVPVINHPTKVIATSRDKTIQLIKDVPGVIIPRTIAFSAEGKAVADLVDEVVAIFSYPMIFRTLFKQEGRGMIKVDDRAALEKALSDAPDTFYVTEFVECRDESGYYRKIRAAVVGEEIHIVRTDYDTQWNIHGRKSEERAKLYLDNPALLETEKKICADPDAELGSSVMAALEQIRQRIPLEVFGVDFDVTQKGEMLFFEANAAMNLLSTAHPSVPYPAHAEERLLSGFRRLIQESGEKA